MVAAWTLKHVARSVSKGLYCHSWFDRITPLVSYYDLRRFPRAKRTVGIPVTRLYKEQMKHRFQSAG